VVVGGKIRRVAVDHGAAITVYTSDRGIRQQARRGETARVRSRRRGIGVMNAAKDQAAVAGVELMEDRTVHKCSGVWGGMRSFGNDTARRRLDFRCGVRGAGGTLMSGRIDVLRES